MKFWESENESFSYFFLVNMNWHPHEHLKPVVYKTIGLVRKYRKPMKATEDSKRTIAVFKEEDEMKLVDFLKYSEMLNSKRLKDIHDPNKREA